MLDAIYKKGIVAHCIMVHIVGDCNEFQNFVARNNSVHRLKNIRTFVQPDFVQ